MAAPEYPQHAAFTAGAERADSRERPALFGGSVTDEKVLVLFSGGQDSTTVLAAAIHTHGIDNVYTLTIDYGQRHRLAECKASYYVRQALGFQPNDRGEILKLPNHMFETTSPLLSGAPLPEYETDADFEAGLQDTFIEGRNIVFLSIAANRAAARGISLIYLGISQADSGGYPDCREGFLNRMEAALRAGLDRERLVLIAPLLRLSKKETVELALNLQKLGSPVMEALAYSHTCYAGEVPPCGKCHACVLRANGFAQAQTPDPLISRLDANAEREASRV